MQPVKVIKQIHVAASAEDAWSFIATRYFENHSQWDPAIVGMANLTGGAVRLGTAGIETRRFLGRQHARFEVTEFVAPKRFAFRNVSGPFHLERSYTLEPEAGGTAITFSFEMQRKPAAKPLFLLARRQIEAQVVANIDRLAALLS
ncbi:MAG TPA: SRPBCC family protein [Mycobacteriales bacterium]|nr:SRPBCC family protein [Mycobacteriales bacterium]